MSIFQHLNRFFLGRAAIFIVSLAAIIYLMPRADKVNLSFAEGEKWNHPVLTASFEIPVYLEDSVQKSLIDSIKKEFKPVYRFVDNPYDSLRSVLAAIDSRVMTEAQTASIIKNIESVYKKGVVSVPTYREIGSEPTITVLDGVKSLSLRTGNIISLVQAHDEIRQKLQTATNEGYLDGIDIYSLLGPSIVKDTAETNRLYEEKVIPATRAISSIKPGQTIIDRGEIVTPQLGKIISTYKEMFAERYSDSAAERVASIAGRILVTIIILAGLFIYLYLYRRDIFDSIRSLSAVMLLFAVFYVLGVVISVTFHLGLFLVPFAILAIVIVVFFDANTAIFFYLGEILLCACYSPSPMELIFIEMTVGLVAVFSLRELSRRSQLLRTALFAFFAYIISYIAIDLLLTSSVTTISGRMLGFFAINGVLITFAYILIFIIEKTFGLISSVTLVELSDINLPLLRALSEKCPGTFQHAMGVGNLAAIAATRIGADPLLVRTGALYHDIGKINNPAFFTENQHGVNPHDSLSPEQSAYVLHRHVTDGLKMAEKAKLPAVIRDMIAQHHGKSKAKYFYIKYQQQHPGEPVDDELFTYPGPNPQTREASLLMMADAVEAASRSLKDYSPEAITKLVNTIIDGQVAEGLHRESPLSFRDIMLAKEAFISRLRTMYHTRVAYPPAPRHPAAAPEAPETPAEPAPEPPSTTPEPVTPNPTDRNTPDHTPSASEKTDFTPRIPQ
ncbi:MAG: HDIG domain-containing protein [Muribaculaceae bacterium]|nr:HDIG domain-containing protein [Muribaculaceae bacterium]